MHRNFQSINHIIKSIYNNYFPDLSRTPLIRPPRRPTEVKRDPTEKECTFFTKTVCLEVADYPQ